MRAWVRGHPRHTDVAVAAVMVTFAMLSLHAYARIAPPGEDVADGPLAYALVFVLLAPLAVRRRYPLTVLLVVAATFVPFRVIEVPEGTVSSTALFLAIYTAGAYGERHRDRVRALCVAAMIALLLWSFVFQVDHDQADLGLVLVVDFLANVFYFLAAWAMGDFWRDRRQQEIELVVRADELERSRVANARRAVLDERLRIARELHDVVAHHVSVMGVQAGAARHVLERQPTAAAEALAVIEQSSRDAVTELHRLLGFLRDDDRAPRLGGRTDVASPQPTLAHLDALVAELVDAGLAVTLTVEGTPRPVPPGVELSVYRIVQEALTNSRKHAGPGARARVVLRHQATAIEVAVVDDGPVDAGTAVGAVPALAVDGGGLGVVGMRERASLHDGELRVGRRPGGGFEVRAWFPLDGGAS